MEIRFITKEEYWERLKSSTPLFDGYRVLALPKSEEPSPMFTIEEASRYLRMSRRKLSQLCRDGKIRHFMDGGKYLFTEEMLREYVDNHTVPAKESAKPGDLPTSRAEPARDEPSEESSLEDIRRDLRSLRDEAN